MQLFTHILICISYSSLPSFLFLSIHFVSFSPFQAALIPTCPLATSSAFATHGLARLHSLLASAQTARDSALCAPGRARSQWWLGDEEAISAARDALAAADGAEGPTVASATTGKTTDSSLSSAAWVSPAAMDTHSSATIFANRPGGDALASPNSSMSDATPSAMIQEGSPKYGSSSVTSARCAHAALDFLTGARAFSAPAHPRPTPIAQASSIGSPFAWLPAVIAGLNAHLWSRPGASHVSQQRCGTGGIGHAKESVPAGETRDSVATTKKKIDRSRRAAAGPRRLPLHIVWPSLQQVLKSIEGRYVRFARRHIVFFPGAEYKVDRNKTTYISLWPLCLTCFPVHPRDAGRRLATVTRWHAPLPRAMVDALSLGGLGRARARDATHQELLPAPARDGRRR